MRTITLDAPIFDIEEVIRCMGVSSSGPGANQRLQAVLDRLRPLANDFIDAHCLYELVDVQITSPREIFLAGSIAMQCTSSFFEGATQVAVMVMSIGDRLEQEVSRLFKNGELLEGLALEGYGLAVLDELLGVAREILLVGAVANNQELGYSLSPGCRLIPLAEQQVIFSLLQTSIIGVHLTDKCLMVPAKSTSYIIPVGKKLLKSNNSPYICDVCDAQRNCAFNKEKVGK